MKNKNYFLVAGQLTLAASILLGHFVKQSAPISFLIGMMTGLSIVFNLYYLVTLRRTKDV